MTVPLQQFLAGAIPRTIPSGRGASVLTDISQNLQAVFDLTRQASLVEWDAHTITAAVTSTPQFAVPQTAFNVTTVYHHIGVQRVLGIVDTVDWFASVSYPGLSVPIQVIRVSVEEGDGMVDMIGMAFPGSGQRFVYRNAQPLVIWPGGSLIVQRSVTILGTDSVRMEYVREIIGGPNSAQLQTDLTGGFV